MLFVIISFIVELFSLILIARIVLDYVRIFARTWTPQGIGLFFAESVYIITDPVVNFVRRFIKPVRIGPVALDLSFIFIFIALQLILRVVGSFL
jgi:YggT family protein